MKKKRIQSTVLIMSLFFVLTLHGISSAKQAVHVNKGKIKKTDSVMKTIKNKPVIRDGGSSGVYNPGVYLVVSKVVIERGDLVPVPKEELK